jgi:hypothetical protein
MTTKPPTQHEILVRCLASNRQWIPTHGLMMIKTGYGFIGSAGHVRARELARNDCPAPLKNKVERAAGRDIGLDPRYEYFRYKVPTVEQMPLGI